jgi:hypothetical protein
MARLIAFGLGVALLALAAAPARADDQTVFGMLLVVRNNLDPTKRLVKYLGKEIVHSPTVVGNPLANGATFQIVLEPELGSGSQECYTLPASGWRPISTLGYKYTDGTGANGPIKVATIKRTASGTFILKLVATAAHQPITLVPPIRTAKGDVGFVIGGGDRYCSTFGGMIVSNGVSQFKAKHATQPFACAAALSSCGSPSGAFLD